MSKRSAGVLLFVVGLLLAGLSVLADAIGLDASGSFGLAQLQGIILGLLGIGTGLYLFFWRAPAGFASRRSDVLRFEGLNLVNMNELAQKSGLPVAGQMAVEILDPKMLEQQQTQFVPGKAWRIIETDDDKQTGGG